MKLLIHSCCADCALKFIESINKADFNEIVIYFYNPNIHPRSEYQSRLKAMKIIASEKKVKLILPDWRPVEYFELTRTNKKPERCIRCWKLRLEKTAEYAKKNDFGYFSSTLISSQYQDGDKIKEIGKKIGEKYGIKFLVPENICQELKTSGFYKQIYCGCCYSLIERFEEKFSNVKKYF